MISIIIPVLNEARALPATLHTLSKAKGPFEIIIADGRSSDATRAVAAPYGRVVDCEPGRARQMNCGASQARGNVLLFLHADVLFPPDGIAAMNKALANGGVIGGKHQNGKWKLEARFNKSELLQRIRRVGRYRDRIKLYRQDALEFTNDVVSGLGDNVFAFYDPPYIERGKALYLNTYDLDDHRQLAERVVQLRHPWVVTYDYDGAISNGLYSTHQRLAFSLSYSAQDRHRGKEAMFLSEQLSLPEAWQGGETIAMSAASNPYPVYGKMETMKPHPETEEGPRGERFVKALKTVLSVPKENVPNPFKKPTHKKRKPTTH